MSVITYIVIDGFTMFGIKKITSYSVQRVLWWKPL